MANSRSNASLTELMDVLKKSGLPVGGFPLGQTQMAQEGQIANTVRGQDKSVQQARDKYMESIHRIAQADQKLNQAYSDPNSKLYLENPMDREPIISGAANIGMQEAGVARDQVEQAEAEVETKINDAIKLYNQLDKKVKGSGKSKDLEGMAKNNIEKLLKQTGIELAQTLGIADEDAQDLFIDAPAKFKEYYKNQWLRSGRSSVVTPEQLNETLKEWANKFGSKSDKEQYGADVTGVTGEDSEFKPLY